MSRLVAETTTVQSICESYLLSNPNASQLLSCRAFFGLVNDDCREKRVHRKAELLERSHFMTRNIGSGMIAG
jgi:hypothetical protein